MILWFTSLTFASTMYILTAPSNHNCHLPPSPHPTPTSSLIHQWRGGAAIWRWVIHFINMFCLDVLTHLNLFWNSRCFVASSTTSPTLTTNPNRPCGSQIYIIGEGMQRWQGKKCILSTWFALMIWTHVNTFRNHHDVSWHRPQHRPHQPQTPTYHSELKYTSLARGCDDGKVRN